ncbi:MAG: two pore domain potassium channel family protein [Planctomycetota bacterium]|nr:MAG: two pore domain potassium channel family protein [Planctomycetota bacterium]
MIHRASRLGPPSPLPNAATPAQRLLRSRLWTSLRAVVLLLFFGSSGYFLLGHLHATGALEPRLAEPWSPLDCLYVTAITVSTTGYGEVFPSPPGRPWRISPSTAPTPWA